MSDATNRRRPNTSVVAEEARLMRDVVVIAAVDASFAIVLLFMPSEQGRKKEFDRRGRESTVTSTLTVAFLRSLRSLAGLHSRSLFHLMLRRNDGVAEDEWSSLFKFGSKVSLLR